MPSRRPDPTDVSGEEWAFAAPYLPFAGRTCSATQVQPEGDVQRPVLDGSCVRARGVCCPIFSAVGRRVLADTTLVAGRLFRGDGA